LCSHRRVAADSGRPRPGLSRRKAVGSGPRCGCDKAVHHMSGGGDQGRRGAMRYGRAKSATGRARSSGGRKLCLFHPRSGRMASSRPAVGVSRRASDGAAAYHRVAQWRVVSGWPGVSRT
jgi:hypothetical protein